MADLRRYKRRQATPVTAVQLDLDTDGFVYRKWGGDQRCKAGDWLVCNGDDTYTVDREAFARSYSRVSPGVYRKIGKAWAERAEEAGSIDTFEGSTAYAAGDYLVFEDRERNGGYAVTAERFKALYEPAD
jgi:hypothetical protein